MNLSSNSNIGVVTGGRSQPSDMDWPGWKLHPLKGEYKGFHGVWVSGNFRVWFRMKDGDAFDVDYGDYH